MGGSLGMFAAGLSIVKTLFSDRSSPAAPAAASVVAPIPVAPIVAPPVTMPSPNDSNTALAEQNSIRDQQARIGRASTVLTSDAGGSDKLG